MGRLDRRLAGHSVVGLDTCILIYHLEDHPHYRALTRDLLSAVQSGQPRAVTSVVTLMELTVHPWRMGRESVAREYETLLVHFPHLTLADVTREAARQAARLRARHNLQPADALQVATVLAHGATAFVTNDRRLLRLSRLLDVVALDEFAER